MKTYLATFWNHGTFEFETGTPGRYTRVEYHAKVYGTGSEHGINGGRISKLELLQGGRRVYNYDRGLDLPPQTPEAAAALAVLLDEFGED